jgi:putative oxidoreductase
MKPADPSLVTTAIVRPKESDMTVATLTETANRHAADWLARHSINVLRVSLGLVFLGFGVLKFFPGLSPAESLVVRTLDTLSFGLLPGGAALILTAISECFIGITLISGRLLKTGLVVLAFSMIGILSPLVLFFTDLFPSGPTLEAQYVFKDIVLVAAGMVVAARALGARLVNER